jgi:bifunctional non-homologous end joining protein LigD
MPFGARHESLPAYSMASKTATGKNFLSIQPMLCTLVAEPFDDPHYVYEIKWDGYRIIAYKQDKVLKLESRGGNDFSKKYPSIITELKKYPNDLVVDGEVVVLNAEGKPDFDALQKFNGQKSGVVYYVFDILFLDGEDLTGMPLVGRKAILEKIIGEHTVIRFSEHFENGILLFEHAQSMGLEGIVAKKKTSRYIQNKRGNDWYKIPTSIKQEFVIGGWMESQSGRLFRTLLFGAYEGKDLKWIGHAGGGYKQNEMPKILQKLKSLEIDESPFSNEVEYDGLVHWTKPELIANIKYATFTKGGKIRKPAIFLGFRQDKNPLQVVREIPKKIDTTLKEPVKIDSGHGSNWPTIENQPIRNKDHLTIEDYKIEVTNVDNRIWKDVTKGDLIQYYLSVSKYILPHLKNRPLSLHVKHQGPNAPGVYIKDMEGREPSCAEIFTTERKHKKTGKRDVIDYLVCNNTATLIYIINLGCIDLNPWTSNTKTPQFPDYIVIDLDPSDEDFQKVIEVAKAAKEFFDRNKLKSFIKTSGKTGMHLFIPCSNFSFPQARNIAENICKGIHELIPEITTTEISIDQRGAKLYLDPNQNDYSDTVASAYSVRPFKYPNVSTPLTWKEVNSSLDPSDYSIHTIIDRIQKKGDDFKGVLDKTVAAKNNKPLKKILMEHKKLHQ